MDTNSQEYQAVIAMGFDENLVKRAFSIHKNQEEVVNWLLNSKQTMTKEDLSELKEINEITTKKEGENKFIMNPEIHKKEQETKIDEIPIDIWLTEILTYSNIDDMVQLSEVNKSFNQIACKFFIFFFFF